MSRYAILLAQPWLVGSLMLDGWPALAAFGLGAVLTVIGIVAAS